MKKMLATLALILVGSAAFAGAQGGPQSTIERVKANSTDRYEIVFVGGQQAEVIIDGDNDTDLDLYIYDENGNLTGTRDTSKLRFRLNLADINFGLNIHLWNKNKKSKR